MLISEEGKESKLRTQRNFSNVKALIAHLKGSDHRGDKRSVKELFKLQHPHLWMTMTDEARNSIFGDI